MRVLLIDDNEINLELQKQVLKSFDLDVTTAVSGEQAVELAYKTKFSVIITDISMPGISGFETARRIRDFDKEVSLFALSADELDRESEDYIKSGFNGVLVKPLTSSGVEQILNINKSEHTYDKQNGSSDIFDYGKLLDLVGDGTSVLSVLESFLDTHGKDCEKLCEYINQKDFLSARGIMHGLTGVSGSLYCNRLYNASQKLSAQLREEKSDVFEEFKKIWDITVKTLLSYCNKLQ